LRSCLGRMLDRVETLVPEALQEPSELRDRLRPSRVETLGSAPPLLDEARFPEDTQVLRDRRPAHVEVASDLSRGSFLAPDEPEDLLPTRFRDGLERDLHGAHRKRSVTYPSSYR